MKLISEEILNVEFITEDTEGKKSHFIEGIFYGKVEFLFLF